MRARLPSRPSRSNSSRGRVSSPSTASARPDSREWRGRRCPPLSPGRSEGVDPEDAWREAGLYDPLDPAAADRLGLLRYLTERGATTEQMVEAHRMGALPALAGDLVTQSRTGMVSVADIAEHCGLPISRVMRILLAAGI